MTGRLAYALAWAQFAIAVFASAAGLWLYWHSGHTPSQPEDQGLSPLDTLVALVFSAIGGMIASRHRSNPVGWCLAIVGICASIGVSGFGYGYTYFSLGPAGPLPATVWVAWASLITQSVGVSVGALTFLLFPTGRPASRRWRVVMWLSLLMVGINILLVAVQPQPLPNFRAIENPLGMPADNPLAPMVKNFGDLSDALTPIVLLVGAAALISRFRGAHGRERQQLKWVVYALTLVPVYFIGLVVATFLSFLQEPDASGPFGSPAVMWGWTLWRVVIAGVPLAIGVAILRHRLFDIDVIIRRTLVYGALSVILVLGYWVSVIILQQVLRPLTSGSDVAVVGSTLLVAAAFQPLRTRIQRAIEQRFYRQRYDSVRTLDRFAARLIHEVDLDALAAELEGVVGQTVKPAHVSLWLRSVARKQ